ILLGILEGTPDANDPATRRCTPPPQRDYTRFLKSDGLKGARIGIPRRLQQSPQAMLVAEVTEILRMKGATVVDPADLPSALEEDPQKNVLTWPVCGGPNGGRGNDSNCSSVFKYGMKRDFNRWLALLGPSAPVQTLTEVREWTLKHERAGAIKYGQAQLDISDEIDLDADRKKYEDDRAKDIFLAGTHGIDEVITANRLDALLFVNAAGALLGAQPGYPSVIVPFGFGPAPPQLLP